MPHDAHVAALAAETAAAATITRPGGATGVGSQDTASTDGTVTGEPLGAGDAAGLDAQGSGPTSSTSGGAASAGAGRAATVGSSCTATGAPIVIGTVGQQSGIAGAAIGHGPRAVQAWTAWINERGGIGCRPVHYVIADDGGDPSRHVALVRRLVEDDGIQAIVQANAVFTGRASQEYLTRQRIPVIGSETGSTWFYDSPMYFPQASSGDGPIDAELNAAAEAAGVLGLSKLAVVSCIEAPVCSRLKDVAASRAAALGLELVLNTTASIVQPDYTSLCQQARSAGGEIFLVALDPSSILRFGRSCASVGYRPQYAIGASQYAPSFRRDANMQGVIVGLNTVPWTMTDIPAVAEYRDVLRRYAPGLEPGPDSIAGWTSAKLFELVATRLSGPVTSASLLEGLWALDGEDLGGLTQPLRFERDRPPTYRLCYWLVQLRDGEVQPYGGDTRRCR